MDNPGQWSFHEGFLLRLLKMGSDSEQTKQQRQLQLPDEDIDEEDVCKEQMCEEEPFGENDFNDGDGHQQPNTRRHSHSCVIL